MLRRTLPLFGLLLTLVLPLSAHAAEADATAHWQPEAGDTLIVDVPRSTGYLVHSNGESLPFPVATGRKAVVRYIGRTYRADTPIRTWTAEQRQIKGDRRTFGVSGRFIRLFRGGESSPYGIHSYYKISDWMEEDERFFSMGCIVVTEEVLDVIEETFSVNEKKMTVVTTDNLQAALEKLITAKEQNES